MEASNDIKGDILIVDDMPDNLQVLKKILQNKGYSVRPTNNGYVALESAKSKTPDLILLDIRMPEIDGFEVCRKLKDMPEAAHTPIIFISALGETEDKVQAFQAGGVDYITKPFQAEEVIARVETHLTSYKLREHLEELVAQRTRELKKAYDSIQRNNSLLKQKNSLLKQLSYVASHELRNPLVSIGGHLGFLVKDMEQGEADKVDSDFKMINDTITYMDDILENIKNYSELETQSRVSEDFSMNELIQESISATSKRVSNKNIRFTVTNDFPDLYGSKACLTLVINNLLDNAIKFTKPETDPTITIGMKNGVDHTYYVKDNGMGINHQYQEKIFNLFEQLDRKIEGSGIGLTSAKHIVEEYEGKIWVESEGDGNGCTFCFTIPMYETETQKSTIAD